MYYFLGVNLKSIDDGGEIYEVIVCNETKEDGIIKFNNTKFYMKKNDTNESRLSRYSKFDDITNEISMKVRSDGKVSLTLT